VKITRREYVGGKTRQENIIKSLFLNPIVPLFLSGVTVFMYVRHYGIPLHFLTGVINIISSGNLRYLFSLSGLLAFCTDMAALFPLIFALMLFLVKKYLNSPRFKFFATLLIVLFYAAVIGAFYFLIRYL